MKLAALKNAGTFGGRRAVFPGCRNGTRDLSSAAAVALLAAGLLLFQGCAGYKLGPTGEYRAGEHSVQINPVQNHTMEPRLGAALSHSLRRQVQRDGTFHLDTHSEGDIAVNADIIRYVRRPIAFESNDTLTAVDYELIMEATVVAVDRHSGREIVNKNVRARTTIHVGSDLVSAERQSLPLLTDDLARRAVSLLADGEW